MLEENVSPVLKSFELSFVLFDVFDKLVSPLNFSHTLDMAVEVAKPFIRDDWQFRFSFVFF